MGIIIALLMQISIFTGMSASDFQSMSIENQQEYIRDFNDTVND